MSDTPPVFSGPVSAKRRISPLAWVLGLSAAFFAIFLAITGVAFLRHRAAGGSGSSSGAAAIFSDGSVGVLEVTGVIMDSKKALKRLERFEEDPEIKALVVRINSPGGAVGPSQEIYEALRAFKKPVVASMASVAASGGYYIACAAQRVFANPGTITGSIGVIMEFANLSKLYEWAKVRRYSIKTGRFKDAGAEYKEMEPEARALFQAMIDDVLVQFKEAVVTGRKLTMPQVTAIADGRVFSGNQAKAAKLVDELGTMRDAVAEAAKLGGIKGKPSVVYPDKPRRKLMDLLMDDRSEDAEADASESAGHGVRSWVMQALAEVLGLPAPQTALTPGIYWLWSGGI